jgi:hypothetical protein
VHAAAPDAQIFIARFDGKSRASWENATGFLIKNKVQIINYSAGSKVGPRDGTFGQAPVVNQIVQDNGILWVNSAGNEAQSHTAFKYEDGGNGTHDFGTKNGALPFVPFSPVTSVVLEWNGSWTGKEKNEYDLTILDKDGNEVTTAAESKKGRKNDLPYQFAAFEAEPGEVYFLSVSKIKAAGDETLEIFIPNGLFPQWAQVADHTLSVPGDAASVLTVGATGLTKDEIEDYSSQGPTGDDRLKPDLSAPTGEVLEHYEKGFSGTSGAAPLVTGAAALVLQKYPDLTTEELKAYLIKNSKDLGAKGEDTVFGAGRLALPAPDKDPNNNNPTDATEPAPNQDKTVSAQITKVDTQFNVKVKGQKGTVVTVSFEVNNFKGKKGIVGLLFFDLDGKVVQSGDPKYQVGKTLGTALTFTAKYDHAAFEDVQLFIPNTAFEGIDAPKLVYLVGILDPSNLEKPLAVSQEVTVKLKK